ncbi:hypothetical protein HZA43_01145 [Candidatus Peregrinibacteria bacterium]|nr:hypothetical protein [Candidatus Peregrinibacteria bacterium]
MKKFFKTIGLIAIILNLMGSLACPCALAAPTDTVPLDSITKSPLDSIRDRLDKDNVKLLDYSKDKKSGEDQVNAAMLEIAIFIRNILATFAILWIVVGGIRMAFSKGDETAFKEQMHGILWAILGLVIVLLAERIIQIIYGAPGATTPSLTEALKEGSLFKTRITEEVKGVITYVKALIGSFAVIMIVIGGVRSILASGDEEKLTRAKKSVLWIILGIVLILVNQVFINNLYVAPVAGGGQIKLSNATQAIDKIGLILQFALGFVGLIAFATLIYGAATMLLNMGNEEAVTKGRKILVNALIGILIVISSFAIVSTIIL